MTVFDHRLFDNFIFNFFHSKNWARYLLLSHLTNFAFFMPSFIFFPTMYFSLILSSDDAFQFHADPCQFIPSENNVRERLRRNVISSDNQQCSKRHDTR